MGVGPMSEKERISATVDEDVLDQLQARQDMNVSGLVNKLLRQYLMNGGTDETAKRVRINRLRDEADELEEEAGELRAQAQAIEDHIKEHQQQQQQQIAEAVEKLEGVPPDPDNPSIKNVAAEVGMEPEEFAVVVEERRESDEFDVERRYHY